MGLLLSIFAIAFQMVGILAAMPSVMHDLDASAYYAWAMSTFVVGMLLATLVAGRIADRTGPMLPLTIGMTAFALGLVMAGLAPNVWIFLVARVVQGAGAGALNLSLFVVIALAFDGRERATVMTWLSVMWLLPAFFGPPAAAALSEISWRLVFFLTLPLLGLAIVLAAKPLKALQESVTPNTEEVERFPLLGALALAVGPVGLQLAGEGLGVLSVVAGVLGLAGLVIGLPRVLPPAARSLASGLGPVMASRAIAAGGFFAAEAFVILGLQDLLGMSRLQAGFALTIGSLGWTVGSWIQSRGWVGLRRDQLISLGVGLNGLGLLGVTLFMLLWPGQVWFGALAWVTAGFGMGVLMPSTAVATMNLSKPWQQGRHSSALQVCEGLGNATLTAIAGALYAAMLRLADQETGFAWVFGAMLVALAIAFLATLRIGPLVNESRQRG